MSMLSGRVTTSYSGGVRIPHTEGLQAHSDGDVLLHAICDAMLGASALGDIGVHFPPGDPRWANADSRDLLRRVADLVSQNGWHLANVDATIICERPKIGPHAEQMRAQIAADLKLVEDCISIKATTTERLGFTGRGEGIAAMAVVLLQEQTGGQEAGE